MDISERSSHFATVKIEQFLGLGKWHNPRPGVLKGAFD
jgi:hypothetical protein